jgi:hypothetical protein
LSRGGRLPISPSGGASGVAFNNRPERGCGDGPFWRGLLEMPEGLTKIVIYGFVLFFIGAALIGWTYG